jgi:hypothetical protein
MVCLAARVAALEYLEFGWVLLPVNRFGTDAKKPYHPLCPLTDGKRSWSAYRDHPPDETEVRRWFRSRGSDFGLGVICGGASKDLVVFDYDLDPPCDLFQYQTPLVETWSGKYHIYFLADFEVASRTFKNTDNQIEVEVLSHGRYAVLPPTEIQKGRVAGRYHWLLSPHDVPLCHLSPEILQILTRGKYLPAHQKAIDPSGDVEVPEQRSRSRRKRSLKRRSDSNERNSLVTRPSDSNCLTLELDTNPAAHLLDCFRNDEVVEKIAKTLNISLGKTFSCILPGHSPDRHPSGSLWKNPETGLWLYRDYHQRTPPLNTISLPEVRAALAYGTVLLLRKPEEAVWALLLLHEARLIEPVDWRLPELPDNIRPSVKTMADAFRVLITLKWKYDFGAPTVFAVGFACAWHQAVVGRGLSEKHAARAVHELERLGYIKRAGKYGRYALYLPGNFTEI